MEKVRKLAIVGKDCVACGCCVTECPRNAIYVHLGMIARVNAEKCIGCGKCAKICPAAIITVSERMAEK